MHTLTESTTHGASPPHPIQTTHRLNIYPYEGASVFSDEYVKRIKKFYLKSVISGLVFKERHIKIITCGVANVSYFHPYPPESWL